MSLLTKIRILFSEDRQFRQFMLLCLFTLFNFCLVGVRLYYVNFDLASIQSSEDLFMLRGTTTFLFLIWNLFLAWIPYWLSLAVAPLYERSKSLLLTGGLLFIWLLFLPNAPYILTDLLHLRMRAPIPFWYDLMLLISFAWTGLLLGIISLYEVHCFIAKQWSGLAGWMVITTAIILSGLGVYIGRFLRWNSWDLITQPFDLLKDLFQILIEPEAFYGSGSIVVFAAFFLLSYLTFFSFSNNKY